VTLAFSAGRITATELNVPGADDDLVRRLLIRARIVAPCIATIAEGSEERKDALAILRGVAARAVVIGSGVVASQGRNGSSISFRDVRSAFTEDDIAGLRMLCGDAAPTPRALPRGSFPKPHPVAEQYWPEGEYS
jgi:hypothetical protein